MALGWELADREAVEADLHHGGVTGFGMGSIRFRKLNGRMQPIIEGNSHQLFGLALHLGQNRGVSALKDALNHPLWRAPPAPFTGDFDQNPIAIPGMVELVIPQVDVLTSVFAQGKAEAFAGGAHPGLKDGVVGGAADSFLSTGDDAHLGQRLQCQLQLGLLNRCLEGQLLLQIRQRQHRVPPQLIQQIGDGKFHA